MNRFGRFDIIFLREFKIAELFDGDIVAGLITVSGLILLRARAELDE